MLIEFGVENYRSLRDRNTLSMLASPLTARDKRVDTQNSFVVDSDLRLLKIAAIYGPNASGKSNVISALNFMRGFVLESSKDSQAGEAIDVEGFRLNPSSAERSSSFEAVFQVESTIYRYGFEVNRERVTAEWLFAAPKGREARLFTRDEAGINVNRRSFREGAALNERTRPNALFLSVVAQFNGRIASSILEWFANLLIISGLTDTAHRAYTITGCENEKNRASVLKLIHTLDLGIEDIRVERQPVLASLPRGLPSTWRDLIQKELSGHEQRTLRTLHRVFDDEGQQVGSEYFDLDRHESEGTKKLVSLSGPILDTLANGPGRVVVIDELDARLHPKLTRALLRLFRNRQTNSQNAQLVFTTHDVGLLRPSVLRRDQVWFTDKNRVGATMLRSLAEFKGVRNDLSYRKAYMQGRFGAVPVVRGLDTVAHAPVLTADE